MKKGTWIALGVFAALLVAFLATREKEVSEGVRRLDVPTFDKAKVTELDISGPHHVVLKRTGTTWTEEDPSSPGSGAHPAEDAQVEALVDALAQMQYGDLVSDRTQRQPEWEVDDTQGLHVKAWVQGAAKPVELTFGKMANNGMTYVRRPGQPEVFLAKGRFPSMARQPANNWRRHVVLELNRDDVQSITLQPHAGPSYALERGADKKLHLKDAPKGFRFDSAAAESTLNQLTSLRAQSFADHPSPEMEASFRQPHDVVEVKLQGGKTVTVNLAATGQKDGTTPMRVEGDPVTYLVGDYVKKDVVRPLDGLRDLSLFSFSVDDVKSLTLQGSKPGARPVVVAKSGETWKVLEPKKLPAGAEFDPKQVPGQLRRIRALHASRWLEPPMSLQQAGLTKAPTVEVTLANGRKEAVFFGKEAKTADSSKQVYVKGAVDGVIYAVPEAEKTRFDAGLELFKPFKPPPGFGQRGGIQGLESLPPDIREKLEAQLQARGAQ